jgi:transcriptional regulator with XRE-family HTH domain
MVFSSEVEKLRILIGKKISILREQKKLSQVELGRKLGFTSSGTISQVENGTRGLKLASIIKAARFFGVHPAVLISPIAIENYTDIKLLSKVVYLIDLKNEQPEVAEPLLRAIAGLLEHLPSSR